MSKTRIAVTVMGLVICACLYSCSSSRAAKEWRPSNEYHKHLNRIQYLAKTTGLSASDKQNRLMELDALSEQITVEWGSKQDPEGHARLALEIAGAMGAMDVLDVRRLTLAHKCAVTALHRADDIPINVECALVNHVQYLTDATGKKLMGEQMARKRKAVAAKWLHAWQRIDKAIDKNWNPEDTPLISVLPPDGSPARPPETIADPQLRAQYVAAIEANRQKIKKASAQRSVRKLRKNWVPNAKRFLIGMYMEEPARLDELQSLLVKYVADADDRTQVFDAIKNKKMPDNLILRNTTQPSEVK